MDNFLGFLGSSATPFQSVLLIVLVFFHAATVSFPLYLFIHPLSLLQQDYGPCSRFGEGLLERISLDKSSNKCLKRHFIHGPLRDLQKVAACLPGSFRTAASRRRIAALSLRKIVTSCSSYLYLPLLQCRILIKCNCDLEVFLMNGIKCIICNYPKT